MPSRIPRISWLETSNRLRVVLWDCEYNRDEGEERQEHGFHRCKLAVVAAQGGGCGRARPIPVVGHTSSITSGNASCLLLLLVQWSLVYWRTGLCTVPVFAWGVATMGKRPQW